MLSWFLSDNLATFWHFLLLLGRDTRPRFDYLQSKKIKRKKYQWNSIFLRLKWRVKGSRRWTRHCCLNAQIEKWPRIFRRFSIFVSCCQVAPGREKGGSENFHRVGGQWKMLLLRGWADCLVSLFSCLVAEKHSILLCVSTRQQWQRRGWKSEKKSFAPPPSGTRSVVSFKPNKARGAKINGCWKNDD